MKETLQVRGKQRTVYLSRERTPKCPLISREFSARVVINEPFRTSVWGVYREYHSGIRRFFPSQGINEDLL